MERRFYIPPEFREMRNPHQVKAVVERDARASTSKKRECRSMCMPKGMGMIDPNCQGEDYRVKSGYQPSRPGDAVDQQEKRMSQHVHAEGNGNDRSELSR